MYLVQRVDTGYAIIFPLLFVSQNDWGNNCVHATRYLYAVKCIDKRAVKLRRAIKLVMNERKALAACDCPFLPALRYAFQTREVGHSGVVLTHSTATCDSCEIFTACVYGDRCDDGRGFGPSYSSDRCRCRHCRHSQPWWVRSPYPNFSLHVCNSIHSPHSTSGLWEVDGSVGCASRHA